MKKGWIVTQEVKNKEALEPYLDPKFPKVVIWNVYDPFWGSCDCAEGMIKRLQDEGANDKKYVWLKCDFSLIKDLVMKATMGSKPKYYIFVKGELVTTVEGVDYPLLMVEIAKAYEKFNEE